MEENTQDQTDSKNPGFKKVPGNNYVFVGLMGVGKSSIGRAFAQMCGLGYIDTDESIMKKKRLNMAGIFEKIGEKGFRDYESNVIKSLSSISNHVVSLGGGSLMDEGNIAAIRSFATIIWLNPPMSEIIEGFIKNKEEIKKRPFLSDLKSTDSNERLNSELVNRLSVLHSQRLKGYESADIEVKEISRDSIESAGKIVDLLNDGFGFSLPKNNWSKRLRL